MTALLKLVHELQHEVGDVATLVQCGMRCARARDAFFGFGLVLFCFARSQGRGFVNQRAGGWLRRRCWRCRLVWRSTFVFERLQVKGRQEGRHAGQQENNRRYPRACFFFKLVAARLGVETATSDVLPFHRLRHGQQQQGFQNGTYIHSKALPPSCTQGSPVAERRRYTSPYGLIYHHERYRQTPGLSSESVEIACLS